MTSAEPELAQPRASFVMAKICRLQLLCRHVDYAKWIVSDTPRLSLTEILNARFSFDCPTHGRQYERPFQAEEQVDSPIKEVGCSGYECVSAPIDVVDHRPYCRDHFIPTCQTQLEIYNQRLKEERWRELSFELLQQFIYDCVRGANRIEHGDGGLDDFQRSQLLNIILSTAELGRHLRRSPRKAMTIPVRLVSEKPQDSWVEETETILVSRCGALVRSHHSVMLDQQLQILRNDKGQQARARVAWYPRERDAPPVMAIEFIDQDNFWRMDWTANKAIK